MVNDEPEKKVYDVCLIGSFAMGRIKVLAGVLIALLVPVAAVAAVDSHANVVLAKGDNRTGTYYAAGQTVTVDGDVSGDVVCAAQTVTINGSVGGDVLCAGQTITINGAVGGSVRSAGQVVNVNGTVGRNVTAAGQDVTVGSASKVGGDMAAAGAGVNVNAPVTGTLYAGGQNLALNAAVGGDVGFWGQDLSLGNAAQIGGNLVYTSKNTFAIDKAKVAGTVTRHEPPATKPAAPSAASRLAMLLYWIVAGLATALVAVWLTPRLVRAVTGPMLRRWPASAGWGLAVLLLGPAVFVVLLITVIGIPVALIAGAFWLLVLLTSQLFAGVAVGRLILTREDDNRRGMALAALVGVPLVMLAVWVPVLGVLVGLAAAIWTFGGVVLAMTRSSALG